MTTMARTPGKLKLDKISRSCYGHIVTLLLVNSILAFITESVEAARLYTHLFNKKCVTGLGISIGVEL